MRCPHSTLRRARIRKPWRCYVFKHNICGDQPEVLDGMPDSSDPLHLEYFRNPRCPPTPAATEVTVVEVDQSKATKEPKKSASVGNHN